MSLKFSDKSFVYLAGLQVRLNRAQLWRYATPQAAPCLVPGNKAPEFDLLLACMRGPCCHHQYKRFHAILAFRLLPAPYSSLVPMPFRFVACSCFFRLVVSPSSRGSLVCWRGSPTGPTSVASGGSRYASAPLRHSWDSCVHRTIHATDLIVRKMWVQPVSDLAIFHAVLCSSRTSYRPLSSVPLHSSFPARPPRPPVAAWPRREPRSQARWQQQEEDLG
jgi:hypothetical protein